MSRKNLKNKIMEITENNTVTDIDGNTYNVVQIGKQLWTAENLNVSKYRNGDEIPEVTDINEWRSLTTGAWCHYENKDENGTTYGKLYNWFAVNDPRGLAPEGFHIPSNNEWNTFTKSIGGIDLNNIIKIAGGKIKEKGYNHWTKPNKDASNESGFSGLPGGIRDQDGIFNGKGLNATWWSSSEVDTDHAWYKNVSYNYDFLSSIDTFKARGFSVRCLKD